MYTYDKTIHMKLKIDKRKIHLVQRSNTTLSIIKRELGGYTPQCIFYCFFFAYITWDNTYIKS